VTEVECFSTSFFSEKCFKKFFRKKVWRFEKDKRIFATPNETGRLLKAAVER
jgi:hypothetical protein